MNGIRERYDVARRKLRQHDAARKILVAEIEAIQAECEHPNGSSTQCGDYDGSKYTRFSCPDCGLEKDT
jgi:hypothetical protein